MVRSTHGEIHSFRDEEVNVAVSYASMCALLYEYKDHGLHL